MYPVQSVTHLSAGQKLEFHSCDYTPIRPHGQFVENAETGFEVTRYFRQIGCDSLVP